MGVTGVSFSPDGTKVLAGSYDETAFLWPVGYKDTVAALCNDLSRDLTPEERDRYLITGLEATCPGK